MTPGKPDLAKQARQMAATAKCLEVLAPLDADEQRQVVFGLVISTLSHSPKTEAAIGELLERMLQRVKP